MIFIPFLSPRTAAIHIGDVYTKHLVKTNHVYNIKKNCPSNAEKGNFLALDLGGTNFRVLLVKLNGHDVDIQSKTYLIPQRVMLGTGTQVCHDTW